MGGLPRRQIREIPRLTPAELLPAVKVCLFKKKIFIKGVERITHVNLYIKHSRRVRKLPVFLQASRWLGCFAAVEPTLPFLRLKAPLGQIDSPCPAAELSGVGPGPLAAVPGPRSSSLSPPRDGVRLSDWSREFLRNP